MNKREIKFRVYDKTGKITEMYKRMAGDGFVPKDRMYYKFSEFFITLGGDLVMILGDRTYKTISGKSGDFVVMQYTGLKDKNGKEVFEGDVLKANHTTVPVVWNGWGWDAANEDDSEDYIVITDSSSFEVIGNIYENPELLR